MLYQFLPRLADDEYAALEQSIREHGVQVPIVVDEHRAIIDGHHRKEIADRLGVDCPRRFAMDLTDEQKRTLALSLNLDRRHLNREQKRELVERSLKADPHLSDRAHAKRTGVDHKTVGARRAEMESGGDFPHLTVDRETGEIHDNPSHATAGEEVTPSGDFPAPQPEAEKPSEAVEAVAPEPPARSVTGIDGKTYTKKPSKPKSPPRRPLPDQFFDAAFDMGKAIEKVARITEDDRFPQNAEKVAAKHRNDLIRSRDLLQQVIDRLA